MGSTHANMELVMGWLLESLVELCPVRMHNNSVYTLVHREFEYSLKMMGDELVLFDPYGSKMHAVAVLQDPKFFEATRACVSGLIVHWKNVDMMMRMYMIVAVNKDDVILGIIDKAGDVNVLYKKVSELAEWEEVSREQNGDEQLVTLKRCSDALGQTES